MKRRTGMPTILGVGFVMCACGVVPGGIPTAEHGPTAYPDISLSSRPCAVQTVSLLTQAQMPAGLTPQAPPVSEVGPRALLDNANDGSVGSAFEYFQSVGHLYPIPLPQIVQVAEGIVDYGTVTTAERWMSGQEASNRPNTDAMYGNGVERVVTTPALGDDTFMYQADDGAPNRPAPFSGPYVGRVYTSIQVRDGDLIFAVSIISVPDTGMATLALSVVRALIAKEQSVCG